MADDGKIVIGIEGNPAGLNKALDDVEKKGQKTAQSVGSAFSAIGGALAGAGVIASFKGAFDAANRLEASLARVTSSAKAFGLSTESAKKAAIDLAKDGFLSLNQSASALSNLMSTGLNIDQSKKFIEASKNIAAFGNTVGDAAGSIESGIKGIITGSSELVENMSPAMKKLSMAFTENKNKVGESKAVLELYNGVIKLGNQYAGDAAKYLDTASAAQNKFNAATEAASAAIGKSLQPAIKSLFNTLTSIVEGFTKWFSGLNEGTQTILLMGVGLMALVPVISAVNGALALIALNPVTLTIIAIIGAMTALVAVMAQFNKSGADIVKSYKDQKSALQELGDKVKELEKTNKRTLEQEKELVDSKEKLRVKAKELGLNYDELVKKLGSVEKALKAVDTASKMSASAEILSKQQALEKQNKFIKENPTLASALSVMPGGASFNPEVWNKLSTEEKAKLENAQSAIWQEPIDPTKKKDVSSSGAKWTEQRFLETQEKLKQIELNRIETINKAEKLKDENERKLRQERAYQDAEILAKTEINALRSAYAEYIEDKAMADRIALEDQTNAAIRAIRQQEEAGELIKEQAENRIQKIREANARKSAQLTLQSFADSASAANATVGGLAGLMRSKDIGGAFSGLGGMATGISGFSKLLPALGTLGPVGSALGAVGGLASTLTGLFGKSDEERAREAEQQRARDEAQLKMLELQANYQKSMLALQEQQAKLPFENLQRKLRLIDISAQQQRVAGGDENAIETQRLTARRSAIGSVLSSESGAIGRGQLFSGQGSSASDITTFLNERAAQSIASQQFLQLFEVLASANPHNTSFIESVLSQLESYRGKIPSEMFTNYEAYKAEYSRINILDQNRMQTGPFGQNMGNGETAMDIYQMRSRLGSTSQGLLSGVRSLGSEITSDTGIAENLLSVIEQSNQLELEIANNTKKTADNTSRLTQMRENNILDLAGGGIRGFGSFFRGAFNSVDSLINPRMPSLSTPSAISNSLSVASLTRSWQDRAADGIENLVKIQTEALRLLAEIALNTDAQGQVQGSMTSAQLQDIMANIRSRIV